MNKDFEKAYKELARIEAPDLWTELKQELLKDPHLQKEA